MFFVFFQEFCKKSGELVVVVAKSAGSVYI